MVKRRSRHFGTMHPLLNIRGCTADGTMTVANPLAQFVEKFLGLSLSQTNRAISADPMYAGQLAQLMSQFESSRHREPTKTELKFLQDFYNVATDFESNPDLKYFEDIYREAKTSGWINEFKATGTKSTDWANEFKTRPQIQSHKNNWKDWACEIQETQRSGGPERPTRFERLAGHFKQNPQKFEYKSEQEPDPEPELEPAKTRLQKNQKEEIEKEEIKEKIGVYNKTIIKLKNQQKKDINIIKDGDNLILQMKDDDDDEKIRNFTFDTLERVDITGGINPALCLVFTTGFTDEFEQFQQDLRDPNIEKIKVGNKTYIKKKKRYYANIPYRYDQDGHKYTFLENFKHKQEQLEDHSIFIPINQPEIDLFCKEMLPQIDKRINYYSSHKSVKNSYLWGVYPLHEAREIAESLSKNLFGKKLHKKSKKRSKKKNKNLYKNKTKLNF